MSAARARQVLIAAILVSLLLHLILAGYLRWPAFERPSESRLATIHIMHIARIAPRTPPPVVTPAPTPVATPATRASIVPPALAKQGANGPALAKTIPVIARTAPPLAATAAPEPTILATPTGPCGGHANADPTVASTPDVAAIAPQARASKVSGTAAVRVELDAQAHVTQAAVTQSSGNAGLDAVAVQMASGATYTPKYADCKAVTGQYTFTVKFVAW